MKSLALSISLAMLIVVLGCLTIIGLDRFILGPLRALFGGL